MKFETDWIPLKEDDRLQIIDMLEKDVITYPSAYDLKRKGIPQLAQYHWLNPKLGSIKLIHQSELDKYFCAANTTYAAFTLEELSAILIKH